MGISGGYNGGNCVNFRLETLTANIACANASSKIHILLPLSENYVPEKAE